jgi:hypothetical protein
MESAQRVGQGLTLHPVERRLAMVHGDPKRAAGARVWWVVPLSIWVVSFLVIWALAVGMIAVPASPPTFRLFFSDFAHMKVWLATVIAVLATGQLLWAARMYGLVRFPPRGRFYAVVHRAAGWIILALTLPVAYHCLILVGQTPLDPRVLVHAILGAFLYGAFATKILLVRTRGLPGWLVPAAGGLLFAVLLGLWLTSVPWFVGVYGLSL